MSRDSTPVVVTALALEAAGLLRRTGARRLRRSGSLRLAEGRLAGRPLRIAVTGDGPRRARRGIEELLSGGPPELVVLTGVAGGLSADLELGDLLAAGSVVGAGTSFRPPTSIWLAALLDHPRIRSGRIATAERILVDPDAKRAFLAEMEPGAPAVVDLETAVWAAVLDRAGIPWLALRGVGDTAREELAVDFNRFCDDGGSVRPLRVLAWAFPRPSRWRRLVQLRRRVLRVSDDLASVIAEVMKASGDRRQALPESGVR